MSNYYINKMEIEGYDNYLIYEDGRVFSKKSNKFRKACSNGEGYCVVDLYKDGKRKIFKIHRLIALHYIPNPHNYECVDHKDRNRQNNSLDNLRWVIKEMNKQNRGLVVTNKFGISNICRLKDGRYQFKIVRNGKRHQK